MLIRYMKSEHLVFIIIYFLFDVATEYSQYFSIDRTIDRDERFRISVFVRQLIKNKIVL